MPSLLDLANAMFSVEGGDPNDINHRNNNPGNLKFANQTGAVMGEGGFAKFSSWAAGVQAAINQLSLNLTRGHDVTGRPTTTLAEMIRSWSKTDQASYIATVSEKTGIDPNADLASAVGFHKGLPKQKRT